MSLITSKTFGWKYLLPFILLLLIASPTWAQEFDKGMEAYERSDEEALQELRQLAEQGFVPAQVNLGTMYFGGDGVAQDYIKAHKWSNLAASQGVEDARELRDALAEYMTPDQISEAQSRAREWMERR